MKIEVTLTIVVRMNEQLWKKVISSEIYILSSLSCKNSETFCAALGMAICPRLKDLIIIIITIIQNYYIMGLILVRPSGNI